MATEVPAVHYFYGKEDVEKFFREADAGVRPCYRIPRALMTGEEFKELSPTARLLYGLMLDRLSKPEESGESGGPEGTAIVYPIGEIEAGPLTPTKNHRRTAPRR